MPCIPIDGGIVCGFHPIIIYKGFIFEWHSYCGPMECEELEDEDIGKYYEPTNRDSSDEFYNAAQEWFELPKEEKEKYRVG